MDPDEVSDRFWPQMTSERIVAMSTYMNNAEEYVELKELVTNILALVDY